MKTLEQKQDKQINGLMNTREAASYLGVCYRTLQKLIYDRRISFIKIDSSYRFKIEDLDDFIEQNRIGSVKNKLKEMNRNFL
jgi:excisionase family DNA binding protein